MKKNEIIELEVESLAFGGMGIARKEGFTVFVKRGLPLQKIKAQIKKIKTNYAEARLIEVLKSSPLETEARCSFFGVCGGCLFQNLKYEEQLAQKQRQVKETLEHIGGFSDLKILPILPSPENYYYRNKMEFSFSDRRWLTPGEIESGKIIEKDLALGLHVPGIYDKVLNVDECFLLSKSSNDILKKIRSFTRASKFAPYTTQDHSGFWRFVVVRESKRLNQVMINIVTAYHKNGNRIVVELARELKKEFPFITTIVHNISRKKAQIAFGENEEIVIGPGYIEEKLDSKLYRISANSFFQTNTLQAEKMYQLISHWGDFQKDQVIYDLYSGTGSIAIFISDMVKKVVGFELIPDAIRDAKVNCELNQVNNCEFVEGDLKENLSDPQALSEKWGKPDTIIIDPPRSGMHPKLPGRIMNLNPDKIIYVSCNPSTLARDLKVLCETQYQIDLVQPIDMFPHTPHCETVVKLTRK